MTKQERLAIAHIIHSRAVMCMAPDYLTRAIGQWITELEKGASGNADSLTVALIDKERKVQ